MSDDALRATIEKLLTLLDRIEDFTRVEVSKKDIRLVIDGLIRERDEARLSLDLATEMLRGERDNLRRRQRDLSWMLRRMARRTSEFRADRDAAQCEVATLANTPPDLELTYLRRRLASLRPIPVANSEGDESGPLIPWCEVHEMDATRCPCPEGEYERRHADCATVGFACIEHVRPSGVDRTPEPPAWMDGPHSGPHACPACLAGHCPECADPHVCPCSNDTYCFGPGRRAGVGGDRAQ